MRLFVLLSAFTVVAAFVAVDNQRYSTRLEMVNRKEALGFIATAFWIPRVANAFSQQLEDFAPTEPQQAATDGKLDLNAAFVVSLLFCWRHCCASSYSFLFRCQIFDKLTILCFRFDIRENTNNFRACSLMLPDRSLRMDHMKR